MTVFSYAEAQAFMASARSTERGRPLQNNTRMYERRVNAGPKGVGYAIQLHSTDVVTILPGDRYILRTGGWHTNTTRDRIYAYAPLSWRNCHFPNSGDWTLRCRPRDDDPEPPFPHIEIPPVYHAEDPGDEPVKDYDGCIAGTKIELPFADTSRVFDFSFERDDANPEDPNTRLHITQRNLYNDGKLYPVKHFAGIERIYYDEQRYRYGADMPDGFEYKQCPHCERFDRVHDAWRHAMHGGYVAHRKPRFKGYALYARMIEEHGSIDGWREARRAEIIEVREARKLHGEWHDRNTVSFEDGVIVDAEGFPLRKEVERLRRSMREAERRAKQNMRAHEALLRRQRLRERLRTRYERRREEREPQFIRIANDVVNELREIRELASRTAPLN